MLLGRVNAWAFPAAPAAWAVAPATPTDPLTSQDTFAG
jgi:hypothetical protein